MLHITDRYLPLPGPYVGSCQVPGGITNLSPIVDGILRIFILFYFGLFSYIS